MDRFEVPLTDELRAHIDVRVGENGFPDTGSYIKALIERDRSEIEDLRAEIRKGDESGISPRTIDGDHRERVQEVRCVSSLAPRRMMIWTTSCAIPSLLTGWSRLALT